MVDREGKGLVKCGWNIKIRHDDRGRCSKIRQCPGWRGVTVESGMTMCAAASIGGGDYAVLPVGAAAAWFFFSPIPVK